MSGNRESLRRLAGHRALGLASSFAAIAAVLVLFVWSYADESPMRVVALDDCSWLIVDCARGRACFSTTRVNVLSDSEMQNQVSAFATQLKSTLPELGGAGGMEYVDVVPEVVRTGRRSPDSASLLAGVVPQVEAVPYDLTKSLMRQLDLSEPPTPEQLAQHVKRKTRGLRSNHASRQCWWQAGRPTMGVYRSARYQMWYDDILLIFPLWLLVPFLGAYPFVVFVWRPMRRRGLRKQGRCEVCGYSLCGSPSGICPECGTSSANETNASSCGVRGA